MLVKHSNVAKNMQNKAEASSAAFNKAYDRITHLFEKYDVNSRKYDCICITSIASSSSIKCVS